MKFLKDFLSKFKTKNNEEETIEDPEYTPEDLEYTRQKLFKALKTDKKEETDNLTDVFISELDNKYLDFNGELFVIKEKLDKFGPEPHYKCHKGLGKYSNIVLAVQPSGRIVELRIEPLGGQYSPDYSCMGKIYYLDPKNNVKHREVGPAIEWENGSQKWLFLDKSHRLDGPASIREDGDWNYWVGGFNFNKDEELYNKAVEAFKTDPEQINKEPNKIIDSVISACAASTLIDPQVAQSICDKNKIR